MTIKEHIRTDCPEIAMHHLISDVYQSLIDQGCCVVLDGNGVVLGLLSLTDIAQGCKGKVLDYRIKKPIVASDTKIKRAIEIMAEAKTTVLSVYDDNIFIGIINLYDISKQLALNLQHEKSVYHTVIHDLRNSISNLMGLNALLNEHIQEPEDRVLVDLTKQSCSHALDILHELLFMERFQSDQRHNEETEINGFTKECFVELKGMMAVKDIQLSIDLGSGSFVKKIDRLQFKRTLHNLASNAIKFSDAGQMIKVSSTLSDDLYSLRIQDYGIGIPEAAWPYIFDQFSPASRSGTLGEPSTGLGLYFAKVCIERLLGTLRFESVEGEGTTFIIGFPIDYPHVAISTDKHPLGSVV